MKIKDTDYKKLSDYLEAGIMHCGLEAVRDHRRERLGQDVEKRFRWDLWNLACRVDKTACPWLCEELYKYLNDTHIDTALKHFVSNYPAIKV